MTIVEVRPVPIPEPAIYTCPDLVRQIQQIVDRLDRLGPLGDGGYERLSVGLDVADEIMDLPVMQALLKASDDIARAKRMKEMIDDAHHQARLNELEREIAGLQQEIAECEAEAVGFFIVPEERRRWWSR